MTNASSVLALGTSNRFARAVDRARSLASQLEKEVPDKSEWGQLRLRMLARVERRSVLLLHALTLFYLALGSFGTASLVSLLGAVFAATLRHWLFRVCAVIALIAGVIGVGSLVVGCSILVTETQLAVRNVSEEAAFVRRRYDQYVENTDRKA